jgi:ABC-2 type transport system ATP-binding protein
LIEVRELTKRYGGFVAVDGVSFEVAQGEIVGFLGPNGAGKSTTMKMLACYLPPTSGGGRVAGFDLFRESRQVRSRLGYLPENCPLYHEMKVTEYLEFRGRLRGLSRGERKARIAAVLEKCWLGSVSGRLIGHLSKGFRQRVGLADALLHDPPVLILDEPTVGLDPTQIRETRSLITSLAGKHTVLLSTHILPEVEAVCSRLIVIAGGRVVAQGTPTQLREGRSPGRITVEAKAPGERIVRLLQGLSGVDRAEAVASRAESSDGWATVSVSAKQDVREALVAALAGAGIALREVRLERQTLEEFFVSVTAQQAVAREVGAVAGGVA